MLEQWLEELGAKIIGSIHNKNDVGGGAWGYAFFGPNRETCRGEPSECGTLRLRYSWEEIHIGWSPTFDRWANSLDWHADIPDTKAKLKWVLDEAVRLGDDGDRCELHNFMAPKLVPPDTL